MACEWPESGRATSCKQCQGLKARCLQVPDIVDLSVEPTRNVKCKEGPSNQPVKKCQFIVSSKDTDMSGMGQQQDGIEQMADILVAGFEQLGHNFDVLTHIASELSDSAHRMGQEQAMQTAILHRLAAHLMPQWQFATAGTQMEMETEGKMD